MSRGRSWRVLARSRHDLGLALLASFIFFLISVFMGTGMRLMGPLGPSVGFSVTQAFQILMSQAVGMVFGEWRGASVKSKRLMLLSVCIMLAGVVFMAFGKSAAGR
jgi:hypothetical protein